MSLFTIDKEKCNQDGICAMTCPIEIIKFEKGKYPVPAKSAEEICIKCGHCVASCPTGALMHRDLPMEDFVPVNKDYQFNAEMSEQFLRRRRSIRAYKDKPVPKEMLSKLIEIARYAPSGHNSQTAEWLVLTQKEELKKLNDVVIRWMHYMIENMPEFATSLHMDRTVKRYEQGVDVILRDAPALIIAHAPQQDQMAIATCTICLSYLELAATGLGLGTCWAGYFNAAANHFPEMAEALRLPQGHRCNGAMMVGYPKFTYRLLPPRNTPKIIWR